MCCSITNIFYVLSEIFHCFVTVKTNKIITQQRGVPIKRFNGGGLLTPKTVVCTNNIYTKISYAVTSPVHRHRVHAVTKGGSYMPPPPTLKIRYIHFLKYSKHSVFLFFLQFKIIWNHNLFVYFLFKKSFNNCFHSSLQVQIYWYRLYWCPNLMYSKILYTESFTDSL